MPSGKAWMTLANCKNRKYADAKGLLGLIVFSICTILSSFRTEQQGVDGQWLSS
jgi:hypothetical protein